jgi:hypothetical protein
MDGVHVSDQDWTVVVDKCMQTLWKYFGIAVLLGIAVGAVVHYLAYLVTRVLGIDTTPDRKTMGRSVAEWRAEKASPRPAGKRRRSGEGIGGESRGLGIVQMPVNEKWLQQQQQQQEKLPPRSPSALMSSTILEEDDSSDIEYV